ncbi:MAG: hypothetical protein MNPFHGCM_02141 [Gemmatimonadaceae bacterium]|nr:hypothetical protein [Gemmatimonadaceae bacterium]
MTSPTGTRTDTETLVALRQLLLAVLVFGLVGLTFELFLIGHFKDPWEWVPIVLQVAALWPTLAVWFRPSRRAVQSLQAMMLLFFLSGVVGLYLHYRGNAEFELEMYPDLSGFKLLWDALTGATPTLAPGTMMLLSLLGLTVTFRHPALRQ